VGISNRARQIMNGEARLPAPMHPSATAPPIRYGVGEPRAEVGIRASKARADPEQDKGVTGAETHTANLCRYDPRVGVVRG
jgi:hypothetical protein